MALNPAEVVVLSRLHDEALELEPEEREEWISALPAQHAHLVEPLREMLAEVGLESPSEALSTLPRLADDGTVASAGERVGPYRLIREIGRGGMGSVWLAERADGTFERQVALKLPRLTWGSGLSERMARERRIGGLLEHPAIARLYDAGVDEHGRPFFAMEYIDGKPIDAWCRDRNLDTRSRLTLFLQVIRAVAYAHGRLVLHRDLKPANVLVDEEGRAHLLDFGIAKVMAEGTTGGTLTLEQGRVLTPLYASPEQMAGQALGVASDIYSLGVTLFEVLTGKLPFEPKRRTQAAIEEAVLQGDARLASSAAHDFVVRKALRGEVDSILAKALALEPAKRYSTADAMADDIGRHLAGEAVMARPDSVWDRLRRVLVRHRVAFGAGASVASAVLLGGTVALVQAQRAARQAERVQVVTQFVSEMFRVNAHANFANIASQAPARGELLDQTARLIEARFEGQPDVRADLYGAVGRVYIEIGAGRLAMKYAQRQVESLEHVSVTRERRARALLLLAEASRDEGHFADAEAFAHKAVDLAGADQMIGLETHAQLADLLQENGNLDKARDVIAAAEARWPKDDEPTISRAKLMAVKAHLLSKENHFDAAQPMLRAAINLASNIEGASSTFAARERLYLANQLLFRNQPNPATAVFQQAVSDFKNAGDSGAIWAAVATASFWSASYSMGATRYQAAKAKLEEARSSLARWGSALPPRVAAQVEFSIGQLAADWGDLETADYFLQRAAPILESSTDRLSDKWLVASYTGILAMKTGRHDEGNASLRRRLVLRQEMGTGQAPFAAYDWVFVAQNMLMAGDSAGAENFLRQAPSFGASAGDPSGAIYPHVITLGLVRILLDREDVAGAVGAMPFQYGASVMDDSNSSWFPIYALRGEVLCANRQWAGGLEILKESIGVLEAAVSDADPGLARLRATAGLCALAAGDRRKAVSLAELSHRAFVAQPGVSRWFKQPLILLEKALGVPTLAI